MNKTKIILILTLLFFSVTRNATAEQLMDNTQALSGREQNIVTISAFMATGNSEELKRALIDGLNAGLTINETKEVLVQLYAYTGFPRSLNALQIFMDVLKERKEKGIADSVGKDASPLPATRDRLQFGTANQTRLVGQPIKGDVFEFAPAIDSFLKEHLFGDIFGRDNVDWKTRELATIAALAALGNVQAQLGSHYKVGMHNGLTEKQLRHLVTIIKTKVGKKEGNAAQKVLDKSLSS